MTTITEPSIANAKQEQRSPAMIKFGVIGYGYWGPNVVRNLDQMDGSEVVAVCDKSPTSRNRIQKAHPNVKVVSDSSELVSSTKIDAVAVVTPVWTHYELAKAALDRKSTRLNSSHLGISYAVFCLKKKKNNT